MRIKVFDKDICLDPELCDRFRQKLLYDITGAECEIYAAGHTASVDDMKAAIEAAMLQEIEL